MKNELKLPLSEQYEISLSHKQCADRKKLYETVSQFLEENHPAVPGSYVWDYIIKRKPDKCLVRAFVIEKDMFTDLRLTDSKSVFYTVTQGGKEKELFARNTFMDNGERKKDWTLPVILAFMVALIFLTVTVTCIFMFNGPQGETEETVKEEIIGDVTNLTKIIDYCAKLVIKNGGHITYVKSQSVTDQAMEIYVTGFPSYLIVSELEKTQGIKKITAGQTIYTDGKENYLLEITASLPRLYQKTLSERELLEAGHNMALFLKTQGAQLILSSSDGESGRLGFELKADEKILGRINSAIDEYCMNNRYFVTRFCENLNPQDLTYLIDLEVIALDEKQDIKKGEVAEYLSKAFEKIQADSVKTVRKEETVKETVQKKEEDMQLKGAVKIGSVKNGSEEFHYYRTTDGKITVVKEEM